MIYKRTTPSFIFALPDNLEYDIVEITFKQDDYSIVKKYENETLDDGMYITDDGDFAVTLTQEETNGFSIPIVRVQCRVKTSTGAVLASFIYKVEISDLLNDDYIDAEDDN